MDVLVEIYTRVGFVELEDHLRSLGFKNDTAAKFVGKEYLKSEFAKLLVHPSAEEWLDAHVDFSSGATQALLLPNLRKFVTD